ncbi:hypothetical protein H2204_000924 [Knufia peltigerae]|uniref:Uncharacterized protein n=1 Tax=Knufia peltigerae TaxID=1002370 RepID=A0AA39D398_9EURO|nr:hypothetical protein H2204_000924 [Knufia peltigerae]
MVYSDYDDWAAFDAPEWAFSKLLPCFKKSEQLEAPANEEDARSVSSQYHGTTGPIHTSFNDWGLRIDNEILEAFKSTSGRSTRPLDPWSGDHVGFFTSLSVIDRKQNKGTRSYAGSAYLAPSMERANLKVLCETTVSKIILDNNVAVGVKVLHKGQEHSVRTRREVIASCGVIGSPQLLELSGIGDPAILRAAGVECLVPNPAVGTNFQDHIISAVGLELKKGDFSLDSLPTSPDFEAFQKQYMTTREGPLAYAPGTMGFLPLQALVEDAELEEMIRQIERTKTNTEFHKKQLTQVIEQLKSPTSANVQYLVIPTQMKFEEGTSDQSKLYGKFHAEDNDRVALAVCLQYPASRGTVHITTSDPQRYPQIDPGYLSHPADVKALAASVKFAGKAIDSLVDNGKIARRVSPDVNNGLEDESLQRFVRENCIGEYHGMGTCAISEVVDGHLRVKGVKGLRVVDASVFPNNISANLLASVYAVAERAAELIKEDGYQGAFAKLGPDVHAHL